MNPGREWRGLSKGYGMVTHDYRAGARHQQQRDGLVFKNVRVLP